MKKIAILFFNLFCYSVLLHAQTLLVLDVETGEPIESAAVFNNGKTKTAITNIKGEVEISTFLLDEYIYIHHLGFAEKKVLKRKIKNNRVFLYPEDQKLNEVVVSISKWEQQKKDIPQRIITIKADAMAVVNAQTAADVLQNSGQVFVQKSQLGGGSPMIRGFATNRVLISVDGVRMNNAIFRGGNVQNSISIDPFSIQKTEVIFGPGSVIYGSDAIGGVMNFYTQNPIFSDSNKIKISGNIVSRYASANQEKTNHIDINLGTKKWAFLTNTTFSDFSDLTMGKRGPAEYLRNFYVKRENNQDMVVVNPHSREQNPTGYNQWNLMQKIKFKPNKDLDFGLGIHYSATSNYSRYDRLIRTKNRLPRSAEWYYGPQRWLLSNFQTVHKKENSIYNKAKVTLAYQYFRESRHNRDFQDFIRYNNIEKVHAVSANLDFEKKFSDKAKVFYGLEYVYNKVFSEGNEQNISTQEVHAAASRYPNGSRWQSAAGYINTEYLVKDNITILGGIRYSHAFINAIFNTMFYEFPFEKTRVDNGALTGSLGLSWFPRKDFQVVLNTSTGFRNPNIDDIGKIFDSEPGAVVVPNPNLEAEYAYNTEIGFRKSFEDKLIVSTTVYYTYLKDALVRRDFTLNGEATINYQGELSKVQAIQNAAKAYVYGVEVGLDASITENININGHLTITEGKEELDNGFEATLRHAAPLFGDIHILWKSNRLKLDAFLNFNGEIPFNKLAPTEQDKPYLYATNVDGNPFSPSWHTVNLRSKYRFSGGFFAGLSIENITNQRYRMYSSGIAAPGRNIIVNVSYKF